MTDPKQPSAHQAPIETVHTDAMGTLHQHGIPDDATDVEPTGLPTSDRHHTETAPHAEGGNTDTAKHRHHVTPKT